MNLSVTQKNKQTNLALLEYLNSNECKVIIDVSHSRIRLKEATNSKSFLWKSEQSKPTLLK